MGKVHLRGMDRDPWDPHLVWGSVRGQLVRGRGGHIGGSREGLGQRETPLGPPTFARGLARKASRLGLGFGLGLCFGPLGRDRGPRPWLGRPKGLGVAIGHGNGISQAFEGPGRLELGSESGLGLGFTPSRIGPRLWVGVRCVCGCGCVLAHLCVWVQVDAHASRIPSHPKRGPHSPLPAPPR